MVVVNSELEIVCPLLNLPKGNHIRHTVDKEENGIGFQIAHTLDLNFPLSCSCAGEHGIFHIVRIVTGNLVGSIFPIRNTYQFQFSAIWGISVQVRSKYSIVVSS